MAKLFTFTRALADWRRTAKRSARAVVRTRPTARIATPLIAPSRRASPRAQPRPGDRFMTVDGVRLRYAVHGRGRALVLLHGNGSMIEDFELSGIVATLAETFRVILFDRPGFGHSARPADRDWTPATQAALLVKAAARLKAARPIVLGHSWGAMVACAWGLDHPGSCAGLVLASGFYFPSARLGYELSAEAIPGFGPALRASMAGGLGRWLGPSIAAKLFAPNATTAAWREGFPGHLALRRSQLDAGAADIAAMNPAAAGMAPRYAGLAVPVAIVTGDADRIVDPATQSRALARLLPAAQLIVVPRCGHMVHHRAPAAVVAAVEAVA